DREEATHPPDGPGAPDEPARAPPYPLLAPPVEPHLPGPPRGGPRRGSPLQGSLWLARRAPHAAPPQGRATLWIGAFILPLDRHDCKPGGVRLQALRASLQGDRAGRLPPRETDISLLQPVPLMAGAALCPLGHCTHLLTVHGPRYADSLLHGSEKICGTRGVP